MKIINFMQEQMHVATNYSKICQKKPSFFCNFPMSLYSFHLKLNCIKHYNFLRIAHIGRTWH